MGALESFRDRDRRRHPDGPLRAVLIAMKRALGAAQRVVFQNHAQRWMIVAAFVSRDERGLQIRDAHGHFKSVLLQISGQLLDRRVS